MSDAIASPGGDDHHRYRTASRDILGDAAHEYPGDTGSTIAGNDDHVDVFFGGSLDDRTGCCGSSHHLRTDPHPCVESGDDLIKTCSHERGGTVPIDLRQDLHLMRQLVLS